MTLNDIEELIYKAKNLQCTTHEDNLLRYQVLPDFLNLAKAVKAFADRRGLIVEGEESKNLYEALKALTRSDT